MRTRVGLLLVGIIVLFGCAATSAQDRPTVSAITASPTIDTYQALRSAFHGDRGSCAEVGATASDASEDVVEMIAAGDVVALRTGLLVFRCWDGGQLGDFFRAAGQFFDREPDAFVALLEGYLISRTDLRSLVTTLPERDVDDLEAQIATMRGRRMALATRSDLSWLANELESEALHLESLREEQR